MKKELIEGIEEDIRDLDLIELLNFASLIANHLFEKYFCKLMKNHSKKKSSQHRAGKK